MSDRKFYHTKLVFEYIGMQPLAPGMDPRHLGYMEDDCEITCVADDCEEYEISKDEFLSLLSEADPGYAEMLEAEWEEEDDIEEEE